MGKGDSGLDVIAVTAVTAAITKSLVQLVSLRVYKLLPSENLTYTCDSD